MPKVNYLLPILLLFAALSLAAAPAIRMVSSGGTACPNAPSLGLAGVRAKPGLPIIPGSYYLIANLPDATPNTTHGIPWNATTVEKTCTMRINISVDAGSRFRINGQLPIGPEYSKWIMHTSGSEVRGYLWKPPPQEGQFEITYSLADGDGAVSTSGSRMSSSGGGRFTAWIPSKGVESPLGGGDVDISFRSAVTSPNGEWPPCVDYQCQKSEGSPEELYIWLVSTTLEIF